jgi:hypothetical protein
LTGLVLEELREMGWGGEVEIETDYLNAVFGLSQQFL